MCDWKGKDSDQETILKGTSTILVDETLTPIIEDQVAVFESEYNAKINVLPMSEAEAVRSLVADSAKIIILSRKLSDAENRVFASRNITPKVTIFATDAIALIANKRNSDTIISREEIIDFMKGNRNNPKIKGLVFDDPNSSTVRYFNELAGLSKSPSNGIYSFQTNEEVVQFVSENKDMIGIVGLNWLLQPTSAISDSRENITILSVSEGRSDQAYYPSQNNLAEQKYPLARDLYIVNVQGFSGLGVGFASFIAGERGQRLILKSGLLPVRIPGRKIVTRSKLQTQNNN